MVLVGEERLLNAVVGAQWSLFWSDVLLRNTLWFQWYPQYALILLHTATYCFILLHTASYCFILRHTASYCFILLHTASYCFILLHTASYCFIPLHTATYCFIVASYCYILLHTATYCFILLHTASYCIILLHTACVWCVCVGLCEDILAFQVRLLAYDMKQDKIYLWQSCMKSEQVMVHVELVEVKIFSHVNVKLIYILIYADITSLPRNKQYCRHLFEFMPRWRIFSVNLWETKTFIILLF